MSDAFGIALTALRAFDKRLDVNAHNIANVNTTGFKKGRANFQDLLYQQMSGAAKPTTEVGGINPKEIGLACRSRQSTRSIRRVRCRLPA